MVNRRYMATAGAVVGVFLFIIGTLLIASQYSATQSVTSTSPSFSYSQDDFTTPNKVGRLEFTASAPAYDLSCGQSSGLLSVGEPLRSCWTVTIGFDGKTFTAHPGDTIEIHKYLDVHVASSGTYSFKKSSTGQFDRLGDWRNAFTFFFKGDFLSLKKIDDASLITLNEATSMKFELNNDFTTFDGGFIIKEGHSIFNLPSSKSSIESTLLEGAHEYSATPDSSVLQAGSLTVRPFIDVMGTRWIEDETLTLSYNVVPSYDEKVRTSTSCASTPCPSGFSCVDYGSAKICERDNVALPILYPEKKSSAALIVGIIALVVSLVIVSVLVVRAVRK